MNRSSTTFRDLIDIVEAVARACKMTPREVLALREVHHRRGLGPLESFAEFQRIARTQGNELVHAEGVKAATGRAVLRYPLGAPS